MPLTFPSHAAAVLPFCGRRTAWLPPSALVVGSCAPDFAYLLDGNRTNFHAWPYCVVPCLPLALAVWLWAELLVLPALHRALPVGGGFCKTRGLPRDARGWAAVVVALALGMLTHLIWDGFTHAYRFPASVLYPSPGVTRPLQAGFSLLGLWLVARFMWQMAPELPPPPQRSSFLPFVCAVPLAVALCWWELSLHWSATLGGSIFGAPWLVFWSAARGVMLGLTVASLTSKSTIR